MDFTNQPGPASPSTPESRANEESPSTTVDAQQSAVRPEVVAAQAGHRAGAQVVYVPQPTSPLRRWLAWFGWVGCFICLSLLLGMFARFNDYFDNSGGIQEHYHSLSKRARDKVAVINIKGVITSGDGFVKRQIDRVKNDKNVKAVVLRIDSPGGTITGSDYIHHHLRELKQERGIPIVVSMGGMAASGGYYVAMAVGDDEDTIFAEPTTTTGSIGVIIPHYDVSGLLARYDVKDDSVVSHPRKQMLSMTRPIDPDDRKVLEAYLQEAFNRFKQIVQSGRPKFRDNPEALNELATGEIFTATQAQAEGLVDRVGFVEDAVNRAIELADLQEDNVRVVTFKSPLTLMEALTAVRAPRGEFPDLAALMELAVPRAYYLVTVQPPLFSVHSDFDSDR